jgi:hypothetical protein
MGVRLVYGTGYQGKGIRSEVHHQRANKQTSKTSKQTGILLRTFSETKNCDSISFSFLAFLTPVTYKETAVALLPSKFTTSPYATLCFMSPNDSVPICSRFQTPEVYHPVPTYSSSIPSTSIASGLAASGAGSGALILPPCGPVLAATKPTGALASRSNAAIASAVSSSSSPSG